MLLFWLEVVDLGVDLGVAKSRTSTNFLCSCKSIEPLSEKLHYRMLA
jgi:hypothetical protein